MNIENRFQRAFEITDIEHFLELIFPESWQGIAARILESGATFNTENCIWAPRWSKIPLTTRIGNTKFETNVKSCIYRIHDCIHQLWGLPIPDKSFSEEDRYNFKRAGMCGEVAVLTLTEFVFCEYLYNTYPQTQEIIWKRNAISLLRNSLQGKTPVELAIRLDGLLHKELRPKWVRDDPTATKFCDDYVPMLKLDREYLDCHWLAMERNNWIPENAPNSRYDSNLDGLELTVWMIKDFFHLMKTDAKIDHTLRKFNKERRETIILPEGWDG